MDRFENDILDFSVKDNGSKSSESVCNPVEEHLMKQLNAIQYRLDKTKNETEEVEQTVKHISNTLLYRTVAGYDTSSYSDNDLYTIDGEPVLKNKRFDNKRSDLLLLKFQWQYVLIDKWVIGVVLQNASVQSLRELRFYAFTAETNEIHGVSAFWEETDDLWNRIDVISPKKDDVVATLVLDPLDFDKSSSVEIYGTIAYERQDIELQVVVPVVSFTSHDIIHRTYELNISGDAKYAVLALRSTFVETLFKLPFALETEGMAHLLQTLNAKRIAKSVYGIESTESSVYVTIEVLSLEEIRISAKTTPYMNMILHILQNKVVVPVLGDEEESCIEAAKALIEELETYLGDPDLARIQRARIKSDLLIP